MNRFTTCRPRMALLILMVMAAILPTLAATVQEKIDLSLNLQPGQSYTLEMMVDQTIDQHMVEMNQKMKITQSIGMTMRYDVLDRPSAAGVAWVTVTYERVRFKQSGLMGEMDYDSANPPAEVPMMARGFAGLVGQSLQMEFGKDGKVESIEGIDAMKAAMVEALDLPEGQMKDGLVAMMDTQFNEDMVKQMASASAGMYPGKPVGQGDTWQNTQAVGGMTPMQIDSEYTLNQWDANTATIGVAGKIGPNPDAQPVAMNGMEIDAEFNGKMVGVAVLDRATGWLRSSSITQDMTGGMTMNMPNGQSMDVEMTIAGTVTFTLARNDEQ